MGNFEEELIQSLVKKNLDVIILSMLKDNPIHGYKIIADLHNSFGVLLSPGTLYPLLYRLVSEGLVDVEAESRRKVYSLNRLGELRTREFVESYKRHVDRIVGFIDGNLA